MRWLMLAMVVVWTGNVDVAWGQAVEESSPAAVTAECEQSKSSEKSTSVTKKTNVIGGLINVLMGNEPSVEEAGSVSTTSMKPTHALTRAVNIEQQHGLSLQSIALLQDGTVAGLVSVPRYGSVGAQGEESAKSTVVIFDAHGNQLTQVPLSFVGEAMCAGPEGGVVVAGNGELARYSADGQEVSHHVVAFLKERLKDESAIREQAKATLQQQIDSAKSVLKSYGEMIERAQTQVKNAETTIEEMTTTINGLKDGTIAIAENSTLEAELKKAEKKVKSAEKTVVSQKSMIESLESTLTYFKDQPTEINDEQVDAAVEEVKSRLAKIHCVSVTAEKIYLVTGMEKGYGFATWCMNEDCEDPECCLDGQGGCCGQIHVQATNEGLVISENTKYRVAKYDFEGNLVMSFGKKARENDADGFTGCCNPMNVCVGPGGEIFCSQSEGKIKQFDEEGQLKNLLVDYTTMSSDGCRNVSFAVNTQTNRVYLCDVTRSQLLIFDAAPEEPVAAN